MQKIIVLSGITASGKTALSIDVAKKFNGEIVSCDSRQVYKFLDIGTAKITEAEKQGVVHHFIDNADPRKNVRYSVGDFVREAVPVIDDIIRRGKLPVLVGGTGLYTRAIIDGYNFPNDTNSVNARHREAVTSTQTKSRNTPRYRVLQICLTPPKEIIAPKVAKRIDTRIADGMFEETKRVLEMGVTREFLMNLGLEYKLNIRYLENEITLAEYKTLLFNQSMQFIKRQRTWYRKEDQKNTHYLTDPKQYLSQTMKLISLFLT